MSVKKSQQQNNKKNDEFFKIPDIEVPFPPDLTAEEIVDKRSRRDPNKLRSRPPNHFIIYRINYIKALKKIVPKPSMRPLSKHIATLWENEPEYRKVVYKELSEEVGKVLENLRKKDPFLVPKVFGPEDFPKDNTSHSSNSKLENEDYLQQDTPINIPNDEPISYYNPSIVQGVYPTIPYPQPHIDLSIPWYDYDYPIYDENAHYHDFTHPDLTYYYYPEIFYNCYYPDQDPNMVNSCSPNQEFYNNNYYFQ